MPPLLHGWPHCECELKSLYSQSHPTGLLLLLFLFIFEQTTYVALPGLQLAMYIRLPMVFLWLSSSVYLPSARIVNTYIPPCLAFSLPCLCLYCSRLSNTHWNTNMSLLFPVYKWWVCTEPVQIAVNSFCLFVVRLGHVSLASSDLPSTQGWL